MASGDVQASLGFLQWQDLYESEKPFQIFIDIPEDAEDQRNTNLIFKQERLTIFDVREHAMKLSLDDNGFIYRRHETRHADFSSRRAVDESYLPEVEQLLRKEIEGVDRVFIFDWRLRINAPEIEGTVVDLNNPTDWLRPAAQVHVDQSPAAALKRIQMQLPEDANRLLKGRVRIVNVWRPLIDAVEDWPLAVCDGRTVKRDYLVETDHVRQHYTGSTMYLMHDPQQKFYYMSRQSKDDVLIFKNFDSRTNAGARCAYENEDAPHASFLHPNAPANATPRKSIEVRAFVFTLNAGEKLP